MKPVRVASICAAAHFAGSLSFRPMLRRAERLIAEAGRSSPDIIVLPELFAHAAFPTPEWRRHAEEIRGETVSRFARIARKLGCVLLCPILERLGDRVYNALVFISSSGAVLGSYHKMIPTICEMEAGIASSGRAVVVDTPVGRLGALICYDLNFLEVFESLRTRRPKVIFFSSMFRGGLRARYLALECASYVVVSNVTSSQLINPIGQVINKAGTRQESFGSLPQYLEETINLDYGVYHLDCNATIARELRNRYAGKIRLQVAQAEAVFLLESLDPKIELRALERKFKLEPALDYFDRARTKAREMLGGVGAQGGASESKTR